MTIFFIFLNIACEIILLNEDLIISLNRCILFSQGIIYT